MLNHMKSLFLLAVLTGLLLAAGAALGGARGMAIAFVLSIVLNVGTWFFSDTIVIKSTGAVPLPEYEAPWLHRDVAQLAERAGIPKPEVYILPNERSPNAFATGRSPSRGVVAVTAGLLHVLTEREVRGVLAHEIGHIAHRDTLLNSIAATIAGALTYAGYGLMFGRSRDTPPWAALLIIIAAPMAAALVRMAISRTREYMADARAAELTGDPEGLALALEGLSRRSEAVPLPADTNHSVHYIVNGFADGMGRLLSTHPPIEERVRRLRAM